MINPFQFRTLCWNFTSKRDINFQGMYSRFFQILFYFILFYMSLFFIYNFLRVDTFSELKLSAEIKLR